MLTYFAADGSYGDPVNLSIFDTSLWTEEEWEEIDLASDDMRRAVASRIAARPRA